MTYMFNGGLYHDACIIEELLAAGELAPAARDMEASEALWWAREANAIDEDHGSDEWPVSLSPQEEAEHEDASCDRCLHLLTDDAPCDAEDPLKREGYACCYRLHHSTEFPHRFVKTDDDDTTGA
jgi:hypothetical protein